MSTFIKVIKSAKTAQSQGLLKTAVTHLEHALQIASDAPERAFASYELGALHWGEIGDGLSARSCFEKTVTHWKEAVAKGRVRSRPKVSLLANAAENLMLLSLSFDEYDRWAEELRHEAPQEPILREHMPIVHESRERGESWSDVMLSGGMAYIRPGEVGGGSHPVSGACIFQLLLHHRKQLRLSRQTWHTAVLGYAAAMSDVLARVDDLIFNTTGRRQPHEFAFAQRFLAQYLEEYCAENPNDEPVVKTKEAMERIVHETEAMAAAQKSQTARPNPETVTPASLLPPEPGNYAGALVILALGLWPLLSAAALGWKILGAFAIAVGGLGLLSLFFAQIQGCASSGGAPWQRNAVVEKELRKRGLKGLGFRLSGYKVEEGAYLYLNFRALNAVPEDKTRLAHMALRSIVALTLPHIVRQMAGHRLENLGPSYTIGFGDGVTVPFYELKGPSGVWSTLQVGSDVDGDIYQIYIHPSGGREDLAYLRPMMESGPSQVIQRQVGKAFMALCDESVLTL